ncbi:hypothetical protein [Wenyingzhuangia aestuarii]|uniref:hypothetical protein n=1 Tax=Wenyingzhuangia aestuarii TaxID=1647582 RepID=UPI00143B793F|nr:hypothetical protein [Wenyingzhuangia aestuarii]
MVIKKIFIYTIIINCLISCFFQKNIYTSFDYNSNNKTIDFRQGKWLISNQKIINTDSDNLFKNHPLNSFLKGRLMQIETLKNNKGQYVFPFPIKEKLSKKDLKIIRELTKHDYIIVPSVKNIFNQNITKQKIGIHETRSNEIQFNIRIYDLANSKLIYNLSCFAVEVESSDKKNNFISNFNTHYLAKKILKEINKNSIY